MEGLNFGPVLEGSETSNIKHRYTNNKKIGDGTFGIVYECIDHKTGTMLVCKWIPNTSQLVSSVENEIRILNRIRKQSQEHQCLFLIEHFSWDKWICLLFPKLEKSLFEIIYYARFKIILFSDICNVARQLIESIKFLHENGIIHTDLKPENIVFEDKSCKKPIIIDFGNSILESDYHPTRVTTRYYRAPEVILRHDWSYPIDMWSLGCILYEMYVGYILFECNDSLTHLHLMHNSLGPIPIEMQKGPYYTDPKTMTSFSTISSDVFLLKHHFQSKHHLYYDLVSKLLEYDPEKRLTASQALSHPLFELSNP